jgi:hypothetical protein
MPGFGIVRAVGSDVIAVLQEKKHSQRFLSAAIRINDGCSKGHVNDIVLCHSGPDFGLPAYQNQALDEKGRLLR